MIKVNWDVFKAKFSENNQSNFEWFCYLLFCKEFNRPQGIFRYKNQSAIETNPIEVDGEVIGWQAKFYDTALSDNKKPLLDTLEKTKRDYSNLSKLLIYTNQEWGQTKGQTPQGLLEIEQKAKELNITLKWRTASFFESEFVSVENELFAKHFFLLDKSIFDVITEQEKHTDNILNQIHMGITFGNEYFEIDRSHDILKIQTESKQVTILSGNGGVGKTALIKKLYELSKDKNPFYVFKATEFELRSINDLFVNFSFDNFLEAHKNDEVKTIVIDSSEKLLDLKNSDPFKEFVTSLTNSGWKIIFTTRRNYLEDLNYQFFEIYHIAPLHINISDLELNELNIISEQHSFLLPKDEKLLDLIKNPFYLGEYLKFYSETDEINYRDFKDKLWNIKIKNTKPAREICFLKIAFERANIGQFFIHPDCESMILDELLADGILGYEKVGYFITHDLYEEWALEKIIEVEYLKQLNEQDFFQNIGHSLAIRRSFRNWLSENLFLENEEIKKFIEQVLSSGGIEQFWKDEVIVSIMLSRYSEAFFELFKRELLDNKQAFLKRVTFILRLACKEVDDDFFKQLGIKNLNIFSLEYILTKPKGQGWESLINFVYDNLETIGIGNINFILPVINDWTNKTIAGKTTRFSGLIALQFYQWTIRGKIYFSRDDTKEKLFQTICYASSEIKHELSVIFDQILNNQWRKHSKPYYELVDMILTKLEGIAVAKSLPDYVLKLADLFWWDNSKKDDWNNYHSSRDIEHYFGLEHHLHYHPASAYQTPIYWLLSIDLRKTIDFILDFTNKSVEKYAVSRFDNYVKVVEVHTNDQNIKKQYMSVCLWNMYRATSSPGSPILLQSIHMALEKYFLEAGKTVKANTLESWLFYLLQNSESASISAVVSSIVLAYPDKTFNIAKVLFQTKEFITYDTSRLVSESETLSLYSIAKNWGINTNEFYDNERIETCKDEHRQSSLESLFLKYQYFRSDDVEEEEANERQKILWDILDNYYENIPILSDQTEADKTWRLYLSRMDRRKMDVKTEKTEGGLLIHFNPEIDSDLEKYRDDSVAESSDAMKYTGLKIWSDYKFQHDEKYKQYEQYETNPQLALQEVKDIIDRLNQIEKPDYLENNFLGDGGFYLFNGSIPAYVCAVLLRDYTDILDEEDKTFCRDILLEIASSIFSPNYHYQISDGIQQAISLLPKLLEIFPEDIERIKFILFFALFKEEPVGGQSFNTFSIIAIRQLWENDFNNAQSLLFGYLLLKPKYEKLFQKMRKESYKNGTHISNSQVMEIFIEKNEKVLEDIIECQLEFKDIVDIDKLELSDLNVVFLLIPYKTSNADHKRIVHYIVESFAKELLSDRRDEKVDYSVKHNFLEKYVYFVLHSSTDEVISYLHPFLDGFNSSESMADLLNEFVKAEDALYTYDNFWLIWNTFKEKIIELCKDGEERWYIKKIVQSYLFAQVKWKDTAKDWRSFKESDKRFFQEIAEKIGHCPSVLYSIARLLNNIGSQYIDDGVYWIYKILDKNKDYISKKLETNTVYYIENFIRLYIFQNREKIKKTPTLKSKLIVILDFLIEKGSVIGYMLRENIV